MPKYKFALNNGKFLTLEGDTPPSDAEVEAAATEHQVHLALADAPARPAESGLLSGVKNVMQSIPGMVSEVAHGVLDLAPLGAMAGAGQAVHKIPGVSSAVDALYGTPGLSKRAFEEAQRETTGKTGAEKVGKFIGDVGMMAVAPEAGPGAGLLKTALTSGAGSAAMTGAQTGGNVPAMVASGALGAAAPAVSAGMEGMAGNIRHAIARNVSEPRTLRAATKAGSASKGQLSDPDWLELMGTNSEKAAALIKQFGLTGGKADLQAIRAASPQKQPLLTALSQNLGKARPFGHTWSVLAGAAEAPAMMAGHGVSGLGIALPLATMGIANKFPGQTAKALSAAAPAVEGAVRGVGGAAITELTPMEQELLKRSFGAHAEP